MGLVNTIHGPIDESLLILHRSTPTHGDGVYEFVISEYCLKGCKGQAHRTNKPDAPEFFCSRNVHRSVDTKMTRMPLGMGVFGGL